jgi:hypothetical protein
MRPLLLALLALVVATCTHTNGTTYALHLGDACRDPQTAYTRGHVVDFDGFGGGHFVMDDDPAARSAAATLTYECGPTSSGAPAELNLDTNVVTIDPALVAGELAWTAVMLHEGAHWQIHRGPHPERARVHPCPSVDYLGPDHALCNADHWTDTMVMAPTSPGIGAGNGGWNGDTESSDAIPHSQITLEDQEFVAWALGP